MDASQPNTNSAPLQTSDAQGRRVSFPRYLRGSRPPQNILSNPPALRKRSGPRKFSTLSQEYHKTLEHGRRGSVFSSLYMPPTNEKDEEDSIEHKEHADDNEKHGYVCGGKFLEEVEASDRAAEYKPLLKVDIDMPLSKTHKVNHEGEDFIIVRFVPGDAENPFNWPEKKKLFITVLLCLMTLFVGLATTAYSSGITRMCRDLHTPIIMGQMGLFLFNFVCALAPLFLAPFCEMVGRKVIYIGAYACFAIMFVGLALGKNIATILVCRALLGLFGCVGTILVGGTFSDMYRPDARARSMSAFSWVAILGTVSAPIYAGFIDQSLGWRWIEGIQGLSNIPLLIVCIFGLRETRGGTALSKRAKVLKAATNDKRWTTDMDMENSDWKALLHASSVKAIHMLVTEPVVFAFGLWIAFAWFITFLFLSVIPITFQEKRGWGEGTGGLPYISLALGCTLAYACQFLQIRKYESILKSNTRVAQPEDRLYGAMCGAFFLPIGLFIYSFTQYAGLTWVGPVIALVPISFGIFFVFESCYSFTADCYGENSSSAIAGQGLMRNTLGAVAPLFASQFFHNVGSQYAGLILALVATLLTCLPYILYKYGPAIRSRSKLAETFE